MHGYPRLAGFAASAAAACVLAVSSPAGPAFARSAAPASAAEAEASASVLELDGPDPGLSRRLSEALRQELAQRGVGGGRAATTAEVRIALECETLDDPCLSRAARLLGARRVIFGAIEANPSTLTLQVFVLDAARVEQTVALPLDADALDDAALPGTAARAADLLFPDTAASELPALDPATDDPVATAEPAAAVEGEPGELVWGPYRPRPRWKWATFGVSTALLGAGLVALMVTTIPVVQSNRRRGFLYERLEAAALDSLEDSSMLNDVDPSMALDICSNAPGSGGAREVLDETDGAASPGVRNVTVARECQRGDSWAKASTGSVIFTSVMAVSTIVFTTLLFVRRVPGEPRMSFGIAPDPDGGAHVVGGLRF
jgi:hypothetical protein